MDNSKKLPAELIILDKMKEIIPRIILNSNEQTNLMMLGNILKKSNLSHMSCEQIKILRSEIDEITELLDNSQEISSVKRHLAGVKQEINNEISKKSSSHIFVE